MGDLEQLPQQCWFIPLALGQLLDYTAQDYTAQQSLPFPCSGAPGCAHPTASQGVWALRGFRGFVGGCDTAGLALPSEVSMNQQWSSKDSPASRKRM